MAKRKTSENNASAVTIAAPTEENFPRGGASSLTPLEHREISNKVANDLFASVRIVPLFHKTRSKLIVYVQTKATDASEPTTDSTEPAKKKRKPSKKTKKAAPVKDEKPKSDKTYIEQLNFKVLQGHTQQIIEHMD